MSEKQQEQQEQKEAKRKREKSYVRIEERAAQGELDMVAPLDYMLLEMCPPEGTIELGVYPQGETVREMVSRMPKGVRRTLITSRVRSLHLQGLLTRVKSPKEGIGTGSRAGNTLAAAWQITPRGAEELKRWKESQANGNT